MTVPNAHAKQTETGSLAFSVDGNTILTRGGDDTVKRTFRVKSSTFCSLHPVWDIRSFKRPVAERSNVPTLYPSTNAIFSPDNKHIVTGAGPSEKEGHGALLFLSRQNLEVEKELDVGATPVVVQWHPKINQVRSELTVITSLNKQHRLSWGSQAEHYPYCIHHRHLSMGPNYYSIRVLPNGQQSRTCRTRPLHPL
jgi:hypothetical protein